ncbi:MAG: hypothetical protein Q7R64_04580 [bacterium]|nr:hypothetical protein [bacterium]
MTIITPSGGDSLEELAKACNALYLCPKDADGKRLGPLVPYAGKGPDGKNLVGDVYFNFRRIEEYPLVVESFAEQLLSKLLSPTRELTFDTVCGIPHGGRTLGQAFARVAKRRFVYADKVPIPTESGKKQEYVWDLSQFSFEQGESLLVMEDVINNLQNTDKTLEEIAKTGATVVYLGAGLNRSPFADKSYTPKTGLYANHVLPIVCAIRNPFPEYTQDDPAVSEDIAKGNIEWEVKKNWRRLVQAMNRAS